jgi:predicted DCC family thiol-disulfide oxidoreductase YuxK
VGKALRDHYLRIDPRSLGLFRLGFGLVLIFDLLRRFRYIKEFYSNDGVLPNHNHLFNLRATGQVWSLLHAFSTEGESAFAFTLILVVYLLFTLGYKTRVFHAISLVALVSLTGRNILLENAGNYAAIALLAFTLFLPCGSRFSLDSLRAALAARDEKTARALNDRPVRAEEALDAQRLPGWTPTSIAALAVLAQIAIIYGVTALQQKGAWRDGTALYYGLNVERWVSRPGAFVRHLSPALLSIWTRLLYGAEFAIPALVLIPAGFRITRTAAAALSAFYALTLGVLFSFGLYAWTLLAASALLLPREFWAGIEGVPRASRLYTVIYDADCGVCLWLSRVLKHLDLRHNLTFQGNDDVAELLVAGKAGAVYRVPAPTGLTPELVLGTVVAADPEGHIFTRSHAVAKVIGALPLGWSVAWIMRIPGVSHLLDVIYDAVAKRRQNISILMGKEACGITPPHELDAADAAAVAAGPATDEEVAPAVRTARLATGFLRELAVGVIFAAMLAQTTVQNQLAYKLAQPRWLAAVAVWPRMMAKWDVLTPEPPKDDELLVIDGQTKGGRSLDTLTGKDPVFEPGAMRGTGLGQLWGDYTTRMHDREWIDFQRAFRDYLAKSGPNWDEKTGDDQITGLDAYWVKQPIPPPGAPRAPEAATKEKMFTHSRGGKLGGTPDKGVLPLLRPEMNPRR